MIENNKSDQLNDLFELIRSGNNKALESFLKEQPKCIHWRDDEDNTMLHVAAAAGNYEATVLLVGLGSNINAKRIRSWGSAIELTNDSRIFRFLIDKGAFLAKHTLGVRTSKDHPDLVDILLELNPTVDDERPEYMSAMSVEMLQVYRKHKIDITKSDLHSSNLLHRAAYLDDVSLFKYAWGSGVPWIKNSTWRTPYNEAFERSFREENKVLEYLLVNHPELTSQQIQPIDSQSYTLKNPRYMLRHPIQTNAFIILSLFEEVQLVKLVIKNNKIVFDRVVKVDVPYVRNFTFDQSNNILLPTCENKILVIDSNTFDLITKIILPDKVMPDQITYLETRGVYMAARVNTSVTLDKNFQVIRETEYKFQILELRMNENESLISYLVYDGAPNSYLNLFTLASNFETTLIESFYKNRYSPSNDLSFYKKNIAVTFRGSVILYELNEGELKRIQKIKTSAFKSRYDYSCVTFLSENIILVGKGRTLIYIDTREGLIIKTVETAFELNIFYLHFYSDLQIVFCFSYTGMIVHPLAVDL